MRTLLVHHLSVLQEQLSRGAAEVPKATCEGFDFAAKQMGSGCQCMLLYKGVSFLLPITLLSTSTADKLEQAWPAKVTRSVRM